MKYLILDDDVPIIFPDHWNHSEVARHFLKMLVSAGSLKIYPACPPDVPDPQISVMHGSVTLDIKFDKERNEKDQNIIERFLKPKY